MDLGIRRKIKSDEQREEKRAIVEWNSPTTLAAAFFSRLTRARTVVAEHLSTALLEF